MLSIGQYTESTERELLLTRASFPCNKRTRQDDCVICVGYEELTYGVRSWYGRIAPLISIRVRTSSPEVLTFRGEK